MTKKTNDTVCAACDDTGLNSKGGPCLPCLRNDRQPLRDAVTDTIAEVFDKRFEQGTLPTPDDLKKIIDWAFKPRVLYAIGNRDEEGGVGIEHGPSPQIEDMLGKEPSKKKHAYIIKFVKITMYGEAQFEPVARWKDNDWQMKPTRR